MPQLGNPPHGMLFKNAANTALVWHNGRLLALWEGGDPHAIEVPSLETVGSHDFGGALRSPFTAHPKVDPVTGEMMFFGYNPMGPDFLVYGVVDAQGRVAHCAPIQIPRGVMMHDFAITERHTIFLDLPLVFDPRRLLEGKAPFHFDRDAPSRYGVVPRHGGNGEVRWFEGPPCYVFHTLNAYEEGSEVVLHACRMESTDVLAPPGHSTHDPGHTSSVETGNGGSNVGSLHEWRFDLLTGSLRERTLDDRPADFPRCDERRTGRATRTGFAARFDAAAEAPLFDGLVKYDLATGTSASHLHGRGRHGGEGVFVPRPGAVADDDGWLLTLVHDQSTGVSELVVVDAGAMEAQPVARVLLPSRVPWGFHAAWIDGAAF
jgi:carotenoid cleavage dioxygenase